jgi:hypothetical protein
MLAAGWHLEQAGARHNVESDVTSQELGNEIIDSEFISITHVVFIGVLLNTLLQPRFYHPYSTSLCVPIHRVQPDLHLRPMRHRHQSTSQSLQVVYSSSQYSTSKPQQARQRAIHTDGVVSNCNFPKTVRETYKDDVVFPVDAVKRNWVHILIEEERYVDHQEKHGHTLSRSVNACRIIIRKTCLCTNAIR